MRIRLVGHPNPTHLVAATGIALCGFLVALALSSPAHAALPQLDVSLSPTTLTLSLSDGGAVSSGATIPTGCYEVAIDNTYPTNAGMGAGPAPGFEIMGPGVNLPPNNLNSTQMGEDSNPTFGPYVFQSGGTYVVSDTTQNKSVSFTVTGSGSDSCSSSSGGGTTTSSTPPATTTTTTMTTTTTPKSPVPTITGTITATVSAAGKPSLVLHARSVKTLKPGLYKIVIADHSRKAGLIVGEGSKHPLTLSGVAAVGKVTHSVTFGAGKWYFEPTTHGPKASFVVT